MKLPHQPHDKFFKASLKERQKAEMALIKAATGLTDTELAEIAKETEE